MSWLGNARARARRTRSAAAIGVVLAARLWVCAQQPVLRDPGSDVPADANTLAGVRALLDAGKFHEADETVRVYLRDNDDSAAAHEMLAYALLRENKPAESLKEYTRAAAMERPTSGTLVHVGQDYVLLGDMADADKWTLRAVQMDPSDADAWYSLGRIRYTEQRFSDALSCFQRVLKLVPKSVKAENNLGLAYEATNQTDAAVAAYRQAIEWQNEGPRDQVSEQPLLNLGIVLLHRGNLAEAEPLLTKAAELAPKDPRIHEQLGHLEMQKANYGSAEVELRKACELDPDNSSLHFLLGQAYRHENKQQQAQSEFAISARLAKTASP